MIDFSLTEEQLQLRADVVAFAETLNEGVSERDQSGQFPYNMWKRCAEFGLLTMANPSEEGKASDLVSAAVAMEALGYGCRDNGLTYALATHLWTVQHPIGVYGSEEQRQRFLPAMASGELIGAHAITEPEAGSDHTAVTTLAIPTEGGYVLTGTKRYITFAPIADVALVLATIDPDKGRWGLTSFLVDLNSPGVEQSPATEKMGLRSVPMGEIELDGCFVPESDRLGPEGAGAALASASLGRERALIVATTVGALERILEDSIAYAQDRKQFGTPIGRFQSVSNRMVQMKLDLELARLLLYKVVWMIQAGEDVTLEGALLKLHMSESFLAASLDAIRIHGGAGYLVETGLERELRDAVGGVIYAGTSDIQRVVIARMLGL